MPYVCLIGFSLSLPGVSFRESAIVLVLLLVLLPKASGTPDETCSALNIVKSQLSHTRLTMQRSSPVTRTRKAWVNKLRCAVDDDYSAGGVRMPR